MGQRRCSRDQFRRAAGGGRSRQGRPRSKSSSADRPCRTVRPAWRYGTAGLGIRRRSAPPPAPTLGNCDRDGRLVHIQSNLCDKVYLARPPCLRLGAGPPAQSSGKPPALTRRTSGLEGFLYSSRLPFDDVHELRQREAAGRHPIEQCLKPVRSNVRNLARAMWNVAHRLTFCPALV